MEKVTKNYRIIAIGSHALDLGFKIAGVTSSYAVERPEDAERIIKEMLIHEDVGIIVLTSKLSSGIRDRKIRNAIESSMKPLFIVVSDINDASVYKDNLRQLIIRALGIDILKTKN